MEITVTKPKIMRPRVLATPYGNMIIKEPVLLALLASPSMQRLKAINQYGITPYITELASFSRYDHSIGVLVLLQLYNASLPEQIAGLLHDVSHTIFSHLGDVIFNHHDNENSYQDDMHEWFIKNTELAVILKQHNFSVKDILHKHNHFPALEQDIPHLCADRIEYNLHGALVENLFTLQDIKAIQKDLFFDGEQWYFSTKESAQQFAHIALHLPQQVYTNAASCLITDWAAQAIRYALKNKLLTSDEVHFSTDKKILKKLNKITNPAIADLMYKIHHHKDLFIFGTEQDHDLQLPIKFRGVDPLVKTQQGIQPLTKIDNTFATEYERIKKHAFKGWFIKFISPQNLSIDQAQKQS
jgi:uncharacterized protein